jgi:hypothetical protein
MVSEPINNSLSFSRLSQNDNVISTELSFSTGAPDAKVAPIVVGGAIFFGKALVGGAIGAAASWGATNYLNNRFPAKK